jgi:lipid II:glycine glycyltransferase (peptidoglycan interpeptide bridge formation enzyme)
VTSGASLIDSFSLAPIDYRELDGSGNMLQSGFWGDFKSAAGWTPYGYRWLAGEYDGRLLVLVRQFPGNISMAYVPYGPALPETVSNDSVATSDLLIAIGREMKSTLPGNCFMIRFDLTGGTRAAIVSSEAGISPDPLKKPLRSAPYRVQPQDTVILKLQDDEKSLLAGMHKKTRYNIGLASKKGVEIRRYTGESALLILPEWYRLYEETGLRDGISLHPESYYRNLFVGAEAAGDQGLSLSLYTANHEKDVLSGIIVAKMARRAVYMYGASGALKRELMPNQLLQWTAIRDARNEGANEYDFFGIPPADDPSHPMHGLWRFKTGFGGDICHYLGAWDFVCKPVLYAGYRQAEKLRGRMAALRKRRG